MTYADEKSTSDRRKLRNPLYCFAILLLLTGPSASIHAQAVVTVAQLQQFLASRQAEETPDAELADRLSSVALSEQLTPVTLSRLFAQTDIGPKSAEQVQLLAFASIFCPPPRAELPNIPAPDSAARAKMIAAAVSYVNTSLHQLPDFLATRDNLSFASTSEQSNRKRVKPRAIMHIVRETRREIAFRDGREIADTSSADSGFSTWGEFGPILKTVVGDSFAGSVIWVRWQTSESAVPVAVFRFSVPRDASHYLVDFCCYRKNEDDPMVFPFRARPGYHGELSVDPATGVIDRISLQADLNDDDPVTSSGIAVQYGKIEIGGKSYVCPIRGIAVSEVHNRVTEPVDEVGLEKHINVVRFLNYHKFGSTARILTK